MFLVRQKRRVLAPQWLCCVSCSWNSGTGTGFLMFGVHLVLQMDVKLLWTSGSIGINCTRLDMECCCLRRLRRSYCVSVVV